MPKVYNIHKDRNIPRDVVNIMRPSKWGNQYTIGKDGTREECILKYFIFVDMLDVFKEQIREELRGKDLVCCCKPKQCHGDILLAIANR